MQGQAHSLKKAEKISVKPLGWAPGVPQHILEIIPYQPGKPIEETERELGISGVVKLASNENPLGPSPLAVERVRSKLGDSHLYPDASHYALKQALSDLFGIDPQCSMIGNGSNEIIDLMIRAFVQRGENLVTPAYSFSAYRLCAQLQGCGYKEAPVGPRFEMSVDSILATVDAHTRLVFLANPNNPTGAYLPQAEVLRLARELEHRKILLALDDAYHEYATVADFPNALDVLSQHPNVIVLRTFSKVYGLAAFRVGYAVGVPHLIKILNQVRQPFNVSSAALQAATGALADHKHVDQSIAKNTEGLSQLRQGLKPYDVDVYPTQGNFLLVDVKESGPVVFEKFLRHGVIVRPVANYGLQHHMRVSVGLCSENEKFLNAAQLIFRRR